MTAPRAPDAAPPSPADAPAFEFDAFISYSRKDTSVAEALERALERYRPPAGLGLAARHLNVFRDVDDFTGTEYHASVERHLARARHLIVLCSPAARASRYVDDEIARFAAVRGPEAIIPVLVDGLPNNETTPETQARAAFPRELCAALPMPLAVPYDDFDPERDRIHRGRFEASWYTLLANLHGVSRGEVERRDLKRRRRRLATVVATTAAVVVGLAVLSVVALIQRGEARRAQAAAEDRAAVALAGGVVERSLEAAALLLLEVDDPTSDPALALLARVATARAGWLEVARWTAPHATEVAFSPSGDLLRLSGPDSTSFRDPRSGEGRPEPGAASAFPATLGATDPAGRRRLTDGAGAGAALVDGMRGDTLARLATSQCVDRAHFGPAGRIVVGDCSSGGEIGVWDADSGARIGALPGRVFGLRAIDAAARRLVVGPPYSMGSRGRGTAVSVVELPAGEPGATLDLTGEVASYAISPDGRRIAALSTTGEVRVWSDEGSGLDEAADGGTGAAAASPGAGENLGPAPGPAPGAVRIEPGEAEGWWVAVDEDRGATFPVRRPRPEAFWSRPGEGGGGGPVFDRDGGALFARGDGGRSRVASDPMAWIWDVAEGELLLEIPGVVRRVAFHPRRDRVATLVTAPFAAADEPGRLTLWNHRTGTRIADLPGVRATEMVWDPEGDHLVLGLPDGGRRRLVASGVALQARLRARTPACLGAEDRQRLLGEEAEEARRAAAACGRCRARHEEEWGRVRRGEMPAEPSWASFRTCLGEG